MTFSRKMRAAAVVALLIGALVPAGLAAGSHGETSLGDGDASVILLTMGRQDRVTWKDLTQGITTRNNDCRVVQFSGPQILSLTATEGGAERPVGHVKDGFGVLGVVDGLGEPCGRVSPGQAISVALGSAVNGHLMSAIDVDLELKFNAVVEISYRHQGVEVSRDRFSSGDSADDGPDSKDGDNYRYFHRPMTGDAQVYFDEVVFAAVSGAFSLEGGADLASNDAPNAFGQLDPTSKSSQFEVVPAFDGQITCQDELEISEGENVSGLLKMHSLEEGGEWATEDCLLKPYFAFATDDTIGFIPVLEGTRARYTIAVEATGQTITMLGGLITSLEALYDPEGDPDPTRPLRACLGQPILSSEGYDAFWTQDDTGLLPAGETACYFSVQLLPMGENVGTEIWSIYFEDDPVVTFK